MKITESERIRIALPGGELEKDILAFLVARDIGITPQDRCFLIRSQKMPVDFVVIRASDVPRLVRDEKSQLSAGITGSDILWEAGMKNQGVAIPVVQTKSSSLYIGVTQRFISTLTSQLTINDFSEGLIATKYPNITEEVFRQRGVPVEIFYVPGKDEAMQYVFKDCRGVLGIMSTETTRIANNIQILEILGETTLRLIETSGKLNRLQQETLYDFYDKVLTAKFRNFKY